ncbi:DMT family transporter [Pseudalkalibacillus salsuginis]|uniref:DMT family transporter n=1 Tax=Pseudalkalibacillus salsuginis TaxID=2910972 RepID=UPI001F27646D|nr:DMT family transporter [Pseudalkalibacillus salsuginis]MCF6411508.1 DMT family transporter [Pseudalkalibacillus salsuginis]
MPKQRIGWLLGFLGIAGASLTLPLTQIGINHFDPFVLSFGRVIIAGLLALSVVLFLCMKKSKKAIVPAVKQLKSLGIVAFFLVLAFPLFVAWGMMYIPSSHGAIEFALMPIATTVYALVRTGERPALRFWIGSLIACLAVLFFTLSQGIQQLQITDLILFGAIITSAVGYVEGAKMTNVLGGSWEVITWALIIILPIVILLIIPFLDRSILVVPLSGWLSLLGLGIISQYLAMLMWYAAMHIVNIAKISQIQYFQPFFTIFFAYIFLNEEVGLFTIMTALIVVVAVAYGKNASIYRIKKTREQSRVYQK